MDTQKNRPPRDKEGAANERFSFHIPLFISLSITTLFALMAWIFYLKVQVGGTDTIGRYLFAVALNEWQTRAFNWFSLVFCGSLALLGIRMVIEAFHPSKFIEVKHDHVEGYATALSKKAIRITYSDVTEISNRETAYMAILHIKDSQAKIAIPRFCLKNRERYNELVATLTARTKFAKLQKRINAHEPSRKKHIGIRK